MQNTLTNYMRTPVSGLDDDDDDDVYLEYYSAKGFHINYSIYMSCVKHINFSNKA
jgi:hypothetical protein